MNNSFRNKVKLNKLKMLLAALLMLCMLTGCGSGIGKLRPVVTLGLQKDELYRLEDESMTVPQAKAILLAVLSGYRDLYGEELLKETYGGKTLEAAIKEDVLDLMGKISVLDVMADKYQILLTDEEVKGSKAAAHEYESSLSEEERAYLGISTAEAEDLFFKIFLADKVYANLSLEEPVEISDDEARVAVIRHIFLRTTKVDGSGNTVSMTNSEKAEVYNKILTVYEKLNQGSNFDAMAKEYSDDDTEQYSVRRGELVEPLNERVFSMESGEMSPVLESNAGYHIILVVNKYDKEATNSNKGRLQAKKQWEQFRETYNEFAKEQTCHLNEKLWSTIEEGSEGLSNDSLLQVIRDLQ